ncbi:MAG: hypothetical protein AAB690_02255 [Patescibacteria group bacterium]
MAEKKPVDKLEYTPDIIFLIVGLILLSIILARLGEYLSYWHLNSGDFWTAFFEFLKRHVWPIVKIGAVLVSVASILGMYDSLQKLKKVVAVENELYGLLANKDISITGMVEEKKNEKWEAILKLINSENQSDWRQAILEADVMLDELLRSAGYHGDSVGEMLKSVEKSDFLSIENAWEAHKIRNRIAHDGSGYLLNEREAKQTIANFETVFKEFEVI